MEKLQQRLQQLTLERSQLSRTFDQITGALLEVQRQIEEEVASQAEVVEEDEVGVE